MLRAALPPARRAGLGLEIAQSVAINSQSAGGGVALDLEEAEEFLRQFVPGRARGR